VTKERGFTLIELMIVIVIIGILAAIVVPKIMSRPEQARRVRAKQDIVAINEAMELYHLDNGFYPSNQQGIAALVKKSDQEPIPMEWPEGGYLAKLPKDPWGHAYHYKNPGEHGAIDIYTHGPIPRMGHESEDRTIGNWSDEKTS